MKLQISGRDISKTITNITEMFSASLIHIKARKTKQQFFLHDCPFKLINFREIKKDALRED